jgi:hypothetical protein
VTVQAEISGVFGFGFPPAGVGGRSKHQHVQSVVRRQKMLKFATPRTMSCAHFLRGNGMAFDRQAGGHCFDFSTEACVNCGMSREDYEDSGQPRCTGKKSEPRTPMTVPED